MSYSSDDRIYFPKKKSYKKVKAPVSKRGDRVREAPVIKQRPVAKGSFGKVSEVRVTPQQVQEYIRDPSRFIGSSEDFINELQRQAETLQSEQSGAMVELYRQLRNLNPDIKEILMEDVPLLKDLMVPSKKKRVKDIPAVETRSGLQSVEHFGMSKKELMAALQKAGKKGLSKLNKDELALKYAEMMEEQQPSTTTPQSAMARQIPEQTSIKLPPTQMRDVSSMMMPEPSGAMGLEEPEPLEAPVQGMGLKFGKSMPRGRVGRPSREKYEVSHGINVNNHLKKFIKLNQKSNKGEYLGARSSKQLGEYKKLHAGGFFDDAWGTIKKGVNFVVENRDNIKKGYDFLKDNKDTIKSGYKSGKDYIFGKR